MTVFICDERWDESRLPESVLDYTKNAVERILVSPSCTLPKVAELANKLDGKESLVVLGGGGVLDKVKLAVAYNSNPSIESFLTVGRSGLTTIPVTISHRILAIPTTLGTGSETNSKAVLEVIPGRRRLVIGNSLKPSNHVYLPDVYASLSPRLVHHGILEIFFRCMGILSVTIDKEARRAFEDFLKTAVSLYRKSEDTPEPQTNLQILETVARLSGVTHEVPLSGKGLMWVWPLWYLANEMSTLAGITKMEASIVLLPLVREKIGSFGYGSVDSIHRMEETIGQTLTALVVPAATALGSEVKNRIAKMDVDRITDQTFSQWAGPGLALGLVRREQIREIFSAVKQQHAPSKRH